MRRKAVGLKRKISSSNNITAKEKLEEAETNSSSYQNLEQKKIKHHAPLLQ
jgi:hypothetical protein